MLPLKGKNKVTAYFKQRNRKLWKTFGWHTGIDFVGSNDIYSTINGAVNNVAYDKSFGNYVVIQESGSNRYHYFCHLEKALVSIGNVVKEGVTKIGIMGSTGNSTAKHLHYEIRINKAFNEKSLVNPAQFLGIPNEKGEYFPITQRDIFSANLYYNLYPDLQKNIGYNKEALYKHLTEHGLYEGRKFSYVFDAEYYYNKYEDLRKNVGNNKDYLLAHFLEAGINEGRQATPVFCADYYLKKYKDLQNAFGNNKVLATKHFLEFGINEGRQGSQEFNPSKYKKNFPDLSNQYLNNMEYYYLHYIGWGKNEGRKGK